MTENEKQLLLKDLCARLPYHPIIEIANDDWEGCKQGVFNNIMGFHYLEAFLYDRIELVPYLRPMSSMTDEEKKEWHYLYLPLPHKNEANEVERRIDWLNAHHFDYRGLIEKGLALEATEGMYKTE